MELLKSPAGVMPEVRNPGPNRIAKRKAAFARLKKAEQSQGNTRNYDRAIESALHKNNMDEAKRLSEEKTLATRRGLELCVIECSALEFDQVEVICPRTGTFVHANTEEEAILAWNKAVQRHMDNECPKDEECTLGECKEEKPQESKTDYDGVTCHRCTDCGRKYLPF